MDEYEDSYLDASYEDKYDIGFDLDFDDWSIYDEVVGPIDFPDEDEFLLDCD